jgi:hypothetical protein
MSYSSEVVPVEAQYVVAADGSIIPAAQFVQVVPFPPGPPQGLQTATAVKGTFAVGDGGGSAPGTNAGQLREYLHPKGWPDGLISAVGKSTRDMPLRYFIVDDSGSMSTNDGHRLIGQGQHTK